MTQQIIMVFPTRSSKQSIKGPVLRAQTQIKSQMSNILPTRMRSMSNLSGTFHSKNSPCG